MRAVVRLLVRDGFTDIFEPRRAERVNLLIFCYNLARRSEPVLLKIRDHSPVRRAYCRVVSLVIFPP